MRNGDQLRRFMIPHMHDYHTLKELATAVQKLTEDDEQFKVKPQVKCRICGRLGHIASKCTRRSRPNKQQQASNTTATAVVDYDWENGFEENEEMQEVPEEDEIDENTHEILEDLSVEPAEKRPLPSSAAHEESVKRLRGPGRPKKVHWNPTPTLTGQMARAPTDKVDEKPPIKPNLGLRDVPVGGRTLPLINTPTRSQDS